MKKLLILILIFSAQNIFSQNTPLTVSDIKILRDAGHGTGAETLRVLEKSPKWNPGEHQGKKIRVLFSLPITLK